MFEIFGKIKNTHFSMSAVSVDVTMFWVKSTFFILLLQESSLTLFLWRKKKNNTFILIMGLVIDLSKFLGDVMVSKIIYLYPV